jgi:hypothetical protein
MSKLSSCFFGGQCHGLNAFRQPWGKHPFVFYSKGGYFRRHYYDACLTESQSTVTWLFVRSKVCIFSALGDFQQQLLFQLWAT